ncbi:dipeptidase [Devosia beringensis]|uniref:dipeptidase n=1 Tax=Devosia beringensis TaxID=2657486 RepID=UPI00186B5EA6|nr:dipeptidase [Devosia beringensis]
MTIPFFDGHNDTLLKLLEAEGDKERLFIEGMPAADIDLPRAKAAGMAGGFFAMFPPPLKGNLGSVVAGAGNAKGELPPELGLADAQASTLAMTAIALQIERAGGMAICRSAAEIRAAVAGGTLAAVLHIEGAEAIDTRFDALEVLYAAGLRSIGLVWSRANAYASGVPFRFPSDAEIGPGLSDAGKALVKECNSRGIMIDLSHLNAAGFRDVSALSDRPLVATHSNVHAICANSRNLVDWQLAAIAESGGIVGVNYAAGFLRPDGQWLKDTPMEVVVRHVDALVAALGEDGVALGSDFDGAMLPAEIGDVTGVPKLLQALLDKGYGEELVGKIAYGNWLKMIERTIG